MVTPWCREEGRAVAAPSQRHHAVELAQYSVARATVPARRRARLILGPFAKPRGERYTRRRGGSPMVQITYALALLIAALAVLFAPASVRAQGTQITISQPAEATTMDPGRSTQVLTVNYFYNLYDTLTRWDAALKLVPGLALSWKNVNDTTWDFTLRPGVKFHDGGPLTAEDVKATFERNMVPGKTVVQSGFATFEAVQAVNATTIRIITKKPDPLVPVRMAQMGGYIYPARFVTDEGVKIGR